MQWGVAKKLMNIIISKAFVIWTLPRDLQSFISSINPLKHFLVSSKPLAPPSPSPSPNPSELKLGLGTSSSSPLDLYQLSRSVLNE